MLDVLLVMLALTPVTTDGVPLNEGIRWTYDRRGVATVTVDVVGTRTVDDTEVSVLAVVGEWLFTHYGGEVYVTSEDGGFAVHGQEFERFDEPLIFVQPPLKVGATWRSETTARRRDRTRQLAFSATVVGREEVTVPAGEFDAWKIEISNDRDTPATPRDFTAWFVPGVGFVRYEYRYRSYPSRGFLDSPIDCQLTGFRSLPRGYPIQYPELGDDERNEAERQLASLKNDDADVRRLARSALLQFGSGVIPVLLEAVRHEDAAKQRNRIRGLLQEFHKVEIVASAPKPRIRVGEPLPVEFRIRNVGSTPVPVAPALDKSDHGRFPAYIIEVRGPDGVLLSVDPPIGCGNTDPLREKDIVILQPGDELNPIPVRGAHYMLSRWSPQKPGVYTVRFIYEAGVSEDGTARNRYFRWQVWPASPVLFNLIDRMPHGRIASNEVSVVVEE